MSKYTIDFLNKKITFQDKTLDFSDIPEFDIYSKKELIGLICVWEQDRDSSSELLELYEDVVIMLNQSSTIEYILLSDFTPTDFKYVFNDDDEFDNILDIYFKG